MNENVFGYSKIYKKNNYALFDFYFLFVSLQSETVDKVKRLICISISVLLLLACSERQEHAYILERAKVLMHDKPDSALMVLDSLGRYEGDFCENFRMRYYLYRLNAINKLDSTFYNTKEAQMLVNYFDKYGSSNEQMLAYYLLGRAYYDVHEAPMALNCFQVAIEKADTTSGDCDYRQLSRIYGQMSNVFYNQGLYEQEIECENLSAKYGFRAKDTLNALLSIAGKIFVYKAQKKSDSAIVVCEDIVSKLDNSGYKKQAAGCCAAVLRELIDKGRFAKAKEYMNRYEKESGFFDENNDIEKGRESYYYSKGYYYLSINHYDSAEYYFRKEIQSGKDFNNQNGGSRGLALLFQKKHLPDSAAKYALYSYDMNDSVYLQMAVKEVEQMRGMYDYSRNQMIAKLAKEKAEKERQKVRCIVGLFILITTFGLVIGWRMYKIRKAERLKYETDISSLAELHSEVIQLRTYEKELNKLLVEKEKKAKKLNEDIEAYKAKIGLQSESSEARLQKTEKYTALCKVAAKGTELTDSQWQQVYILVIDIFPGFYKFISGESFKLTENEFKTCILIRLHFNPKIVANMMGLSPSSISKIRINLLMKIFGMTGKPRDLDELLLQYV